MGTNLDASQLVSVIGVAWVRYGTVGEMGECLGMSVGGDVHMPVQGMRYD